MRAATWNIQHGLDAARQRVDIGRSAHVLSALDADIVALQECDVRAPRSRFRHQPRHLARHLGGQWTYSPALRVGPVGTSGCALLARGPIEDVTRLRLARGADHTARSALIARVMGVSVATCHLAVDAATALAQLQVVTAELAERPLPWLLLGDLNLRPGAIGDLLSAHGLQLAASPPAFPARAPTASIDHIATRALRVVTVDAVPGDASDHLALVAATQLADP